MNRHAVLKKTRRSPKKGLNRRWLLLGVVVAALVIGWFWHNSKSDDGQTGLNSNKSSNQRMAGETKKTAFDKNRYSINDPASLWVVVNKGRALPNSYSPENLVTPSVPLRLASASPEMHMRSDAASAVEELVRSAAAQNIKFMLVSGYRSYADQKAIYDRNVLSQGQADADASSARPGHSEHQTGLAADLGRPDRSCELEACFGDTSEGRWLAANAYRYGFVIRYQKDKTSLTGYEYEPWHIRYVGLDLAEQIHKSNQTMEQFFSLSTFTDYPDSPKQL